MRVGLPFCSDSPAEARAGAPSAASRFRELQAPEPARPPSARGAAGMGCGGGGAAGAHSHARPRRGCLAGAWERRAEQGWALALAAWAPALGAGWGCPPCGPLKCHLHRPLSCRLLGTTPENWKLRAQRGQSVLHGPQKPVAKWPLCHGCPWGPPGCMPHKPSPHFGVLFAGVPVGRAVPPHVSLSWGGRSRWLRVPCLRGWTAEGVVGWVRGPGPRRQACGRPAGPAGLPPHPPQRKVFQETDICSFRGGDEFRAELSRTLICTN